MEHIRYAYFSSILNEKFQLIQQNQKNQIKSIEENIGQLINKYLKTEDEQLNNQPVDYIQYHINLCEVLSYFLNKYEQKIKVLFPIIFDFFSDEDRLHLIVIDTEYM